MRLHDSFLSGIGGGDLIDVFGVDVVIVADVVGVDIVISESPERIESASDVEALR